MEYEHHRNKILHEMRRFPHSRRGILRFMRRVSHGRTDHASASSSGSAAGPTSERQGLLARTETSLARTEAFSKARKQAHGCTHVGRHNHLARDCAVSERSKHHHHRPIMVGILPFRSWNHSDIRGTPSMGEPRGIELPASRLSHRRIVSPDHRSRDRDTGDFLRTRSPDSHRDSDPALRSHGGREKGRATGAGNATEPSILIAARRNARAFDGLTKRTRSKLRQRRGNDKR